MPLIDHVLEGAVLLARQATTGTIATTPTTSVPNTGATGAATTTNSSPTGTGTASSTTTAGGGGNSGGGGGSSPLLFFIALGFGVVFTNLWIIVGVKYCFRYNARARQLRMAVEDGEPITLENMPHPRRRRREKKLMTIDEVNEKFPMVKYKTWVATRAEKGLPTAGGVNAPTRPNSIRSVEGTIAPLNDSTSHQKHTPTKDSTKSEDKELSNTSDVQAGIQTSPIDTTTDGSGAASASALPEETSREVTSSPADNRASIVSADDDTGLGIHNKTATDEHFHHSDDDDDERIDPAVPPECVGTSGDTCAICIDTLEDDDDVRGLTCGHAFHAVCLDPWLTSRRACCPLCKADYYTPKPRPPPGENPGTVDAETVEEMERRRRILALYTSGGWRSGRMLPGRFVLGPRNVNSRSRDPFSPQVNRANMEATAGNSPPELQTTPQVQQPAATHSNWIGNLHPFRRWNGQSSQRAGQADGAAPASEVTPSQLEAGTQPH
ncbi:hypothetical protein SEPCBS57363_003641 [Sporothrix epigloea]|uniref:RING-type domain-containing protein n=1 Tax=Sporothrix epigloea TaxID=1892477 RepID=A0ABP0DMK8_9PEZI